MGLKKYVMEHTSGGSVLFRELADGELPEPGETVLTYARVNLKSSSVRVTRIAIPGSGILALPLLEKWNSRHPDTWCYAPISRSSA
jgi:hypothetical protein